MKTVLKDLLAAPQFGSITKYAVGNDISSKQQLEQDFANLAFTFVRDRAPSLMPYMVGFEIVENTPDGSKAVGIFGYQVGDKIYTVPVFFINNQIKGMDMLRSNSENMFFPLRESWINSILNRQVVSLGSATEEDPNKLRQTMSYPNFEFLARPPLTGTGVKLASEAISGAWNDMRDRVIELLEKDAAFQRSVAGAVSAYTGAELPQEPAGNSELINWIKTRGGVKCAVALSRQLQHIPFLKAASSFYNIKDLLITEFDAKLQKAAAKLELVTESSCCTLSEEDKKELIRNSFTLVDRRPSEELSDVYRVDLNEALTSPDKPGKYNIVLAGGKCIESFIMREAGAADSCFILFKGSSGTIVTRGSFDRVLTVSPVSGTAGVTAEKDLDELFREGKSAEDIKIGGDDNYLFIDKAGNAFGPFRVKGTTRDSSGVLQLAVDHRYVDRIAGGRKNYYGVTDSHSNCIVTDVSNVSTIIFTNKSGKCVRSGDTLIVPADSYRAVPVMADCCPYEFRKQLQLGTLEDLHYELSAKAAGHIIKVSCDLGSKVDILVDGESAAHGLTQKEAMCKLAGDYGMGVPDVREMLTEVGANRISKRLVFVKKAQQVYMPEIMPQQMTTDQQLGINSVAPYIISQRGQTQQGALPQWQNSLPGSGINIGSEAAMQGGFGVDPNAQNADPAMYGDPVALAQQAAATGQQQVFDQSAIGSLTQNADINNTIDSMIPGFLQSLSNLGSLLFLFYWKRDDFIERYGAQDMDDFENQLRSVFKNFGEFVLKARQKSIDTVDEVFTGSVSR